MADNNTSDKIKADTKQTELKRDPKTGKITGGTPPAGFNKHPENRSNGHWKPENTISYQYRRFLNMTPVQLTQWSQTPSNERTVAMDIAYSQVIKGSKSLPHTKEITDRTEGRAAQSVDVTSAGNELSAPIVRIIDERQAD